MEFDKSRVYTSLNADELKQGDKVIVANSLNSLKRFVEKMLEKPDGLNPNGIYVKTIYRIRDFKSDYRFDVKPSNPARPSYPYAYLVERKENCLKCKKCEVISDKSMHCDWVGTGPITSARVEKCNHYEPKTEKKAEKHYRPFKDADELIKVWEEKTKPYRADTRIPPIIMPLIWVRDPKRPKVTYLLNGLMGNEVHWGSYIFNMQELFDNFEFLDGTPCGVEE